MNDVLTFTRKDLISAFKLYNLDSLTNPNDYKEIDNPENDAISQADELIKYLKQL